MNNPKEKKERPNTNEEKIPFWKQKRLDQLTSDEWESLCDGCGKCCLHKLEEEDTGRIYHTDVACSLLDTGNCRCQNYVDRMLLVPDCKQLTANNIREISWLPKTCAYKLVDEGKDLYWWHPLISGNSESVHNAGISIRNRAFTEQEADELEDHIVDWPNEKYLTRSK